MIEGMLEDLCGKDLFSGIWSTLKVNLFSTSGEYKTVLNIVTDLYESTVQPIAIYLMLIFFMVGLVDKLSNENFTWEQLGRQFAMFFLSVGLITHGFEILEKLFEFGLVFATDVHTLVKDNLYPSDKLDLVKEVVDTFKATIKVPNFLKDIVLFVYLLIPWAFSWIMGLVVKIICYTRVIEIYARATCAPIALSDFFMNGFQSAGWRYIKAFLAVCLQGAVILIITTIYSALFTIVAASVDPGLSFFKFLGVFVALMASGCMLMLKSLSLCKELLGVQ